MSSAPDECAYPARACPGAELRDRAGVPVEPQDLGLWAVSLVRFRMTRVQGIGGNHRSERICVNASRVNWTLDHTRGGSIAGRADRRRDLTVTVNGHP